MKKYLGILALALVVSSVSAVGFAADTSCAQENGAFLTSLAQPAQEPTLPFLAEVPPPALPAGSCINLNCWRDSDCWPHCGGEFGSYCSSTHWCTPY
jgi:hypothetical protein